MKYSAYFTQPVNRSCTDIFTWTCTKGTFHKPGNLEHYFLKTYHSSHRPIALDRLNALVAENVPRCRVK